MWLHKKQPGETATSKEIVFEAAASYGIHMGQSVLHLRFGVGKLARGLPCGLYTLYYYIQTWFNIIIMRVSIRRFFDETAACWIVSKITLMPSFPSNFIPNIQPQCNSVIVSKDSY